MKYKNVIWGLVLVAIGTLFILRNLEVISFSWHGIWRLWPMILVLIGIALLPIREGIKIVLSIITLAAGIIVLLSFPSYHSGWEFGKGWSDWNKDEERSELYDINQQITEPYDTSVTEVYLDFDAAAGNFNINSTTGELFEFKREGNMGRYNYSVKDLGQRREVFIEMEEQRIHGMNFRNNVDILLNPNPAWELKIDVGAADIDLDLSPFKISKLNIDGGASSVRIRLGSLAEQTEMNINSGASSLKIYIPKEYACEVDMNSVLSSKDLEGFNKVGDGTYVTPDFSSSTKNVVIKIEAAVTDLEISRY